MLIVTSVDGHYALTVFECLHNQHTDFCLWLVVQLVDCRFVRIFGGKRLSSLPCLLPLSSLVMMAMKQLALAITSLATVTLYHAGSANALLVGPPCQNLSFRFWPSLATHRDVQRQLPHVACKTVRFSAVPSDEEESSTATTKTLSTLTSTTEVHVPLSLTLATGIVSTLLGFVYSRCMKSGFKLFWKTIPSNILNSSSKNYFFKFIQTYPAMYIVLMTTCGGAAVSYLSSKLPNLYSAHDYVHILSKDDEMTVNGSDEKDVFPSATSILPVMGLCLLTSLSGFSLGPEAPMVGDFMIRVTYPTF